jgi:hypothetical protein
MATKKSAVRKKTLAVDSQKPETTEEESKLPGTVTLGRAAGRALRQNSEKITKSLTDRSIEGNIQSARFLLELAEASERLARAEDGSIGPSLALRLAQEPEWGSEPTDGESTRGETGKE